MSGEVEKCPILHVRPKFDVFTLNMNAPRNRWPSLHTTFWLSQLQRLIIEVSLLSFSNEAEKK